MKKEIPLKIHLALARYKAALEESVKASVKLNVAKKALQALPHSYAIKEALVEIIDKQYHHDKVVKNSMHNIAVLELKEGI